MRHLKAIHLQPDTVSLGWSGDTQRPESERFTLIGFVAMDSTPKVIRARRVVARMTKSEFADFAEMVARYQREHNE